MAIPGSPAPKSKNSFNPLKPIGSWSTSSAVSFTTDLGLSSFTSNFSFFFS